jgi:hypothetical protein
VVQPLDVIDRHEERPRAGECPQQSQRRQRDSPDIRAGTRGCPAQEHDIERVPHRSRQRWADLVDDVADQVV